MRKSRPIYDVFISYSHDGQATAKVLGQLLAGAGLKAFETSSLPGAGATVLDSVREALTESDAFVAVLTPTAAASPSVAVELGGAMALQKPIYLLSMLGAGESIPAYLQHFHRYPASRIQEMVQSIAKEAEPLSDSDRASLMHVYAQLGIPSDRLVLDPDAVHRFASKFTEQTGRTVSSERLMRELMRLRKMGRIPKLGRNSIVHTTK